MARRAGTANKGAGNSKRTRKTHRKLIIDKCTSWLFKWSLLLIRDRFEAANDPVAPAPLIAAKTDPASDRFSDHRRPQSGIRFYRLTLGSLEEIDPIFDGNHFDKPQFQAKECSLRSDIQSQRVNRVDLKDLAVDQAFVRRRGNGLHLSYA